MTGNLSFNAVQNRYEMDFEGGTVFANVRLDGDILHINYVEAPESLRGTGAAGTFMKSLMKKVQEDNLKVIPLCGYAAGWISRHKEYQDYLAS